MVPDHVMRESLVIVSEEMLTFGYRHPKPEDVQIGLQVVRVDVKEFSGMKPDQLLVGQDGAVLCEVIAIHKDLVMLEVYEEHDRNVTIATLKDLSRCEPCMDGTDNQFRYFVPE